MYYLPYYLVGKLHDRALAARRGDRTWRFLAYSIAAGLLAGLMLAAALASAAMMVVIGAWWLGVILLALIAVPPLGTTIIHGACIPRGWYRAAYYLGAYAARGTGKDAPAYGLVVAARAVMHLPRARTGGAEAWLATRRERRTPLGDAEVVMTAFVVAGRGDLAAARQLARSTAMLVESHPAVREECGEWLAVDAAARGAWREIVERASTDAFPATPLAWFLEGVAARMIDAAGAPSDRELLARWLLAPHRRATRALYDRARAPHAAPREPATPPPTSAPSTDAHAPLASAIAASLALAHDVTAPRLADAVDAWDRALVDAATHAWLEARARELATPLGAVERALAELGAAVVAQLAAHAEAAGLGAPDRRGVVGTALARKLRHGRLDNLEAGFARWVARRVEGNARLPIDEWREFVALHAEYASVVATGGVELRRLAFHHAWTPGNKMAAWLWNTRNEYAASHAISRWLYDEALAVGDTEAIELGYRNCTLEIPTRLGRISAPPPGQN